MIKVTLEDAQLVSAEAKPYNIDGRNIVSRRIRVYADGEILPLNANDDDIARVRENVGNTGKITFVVKSPKERVYLEFFSFEAY